MYPGVKNYSIILFAFYQIIIGLVGIYSATILILTLSTKLAFILIGLFFLTLYILTAISGISYFYKRRFMIQTAFFLQCAQVFAFSLFGFKFLFHAGTVLSITIANTLFFSLLPISLSFELGFKDKGHFFGINFFPLIIALWLSRIYSDKRAEPDLG